MIAEKRSVPFSGTLPLKFSEFAYMGSYYDRLDELAALALPEPWKYRRNQECYKNQQTPILGYYMSSVYYKLAMDYQYALTPEEAGRALYINSERCCFHTGLYTRNYKAIYAYYERNLRTDSPWYWVLQGFQEEASAKLKYVNPLPMRPMSGLYELGMAYDPDWPIRVRVEHILEDAENLERIPEKLRDFPNLPLLLETGVELARRQAAISPSIVVPQVFGGRFQYLLPVCLTDPAKPELAMALSIHDGYYLGHTCLTLNMAYGNARLIGRPTVPWLTELVE